MRLCGNTVKIIKVYENDNFINLVMDYHEGGTLGELIQNRSVCLNEDDAKTIVAQILLTVDFMSKMKIVHKDLKPENIVLHSRQKGAYDIRVADFGYACTIDELAANKSEGTLICGTGGYIAPEALDGQGYSLKTDLFSVGSILYCVLTRHNLFNATVNYELLLQNKHCNIKHIDEDLSLYSPLVKNLMK
jgi:serine/threonine protein kinase